MLLLFSHVTKAWLSLSTAAEANVPSSASRRQVQLPALSHIFWRTGTSRLSKGSTPVGLPSMFRPLPPPLSPTDPAPPLPWALEPAFGLALHPNEATRLEASSSADEKR